MGKALIISGGADGLYVAKPLHNRERIDAEIASLEQARADMQEDLAEAAEALELAELEVAEARMALEGLIEEFYEDQSQREIQLQDVVSAHNILRSSRGAPPLQGVSELHTAAENHARYLAENDTSGHSGGGGSTPCQRILLAGYNWTVGGSCGENVVVGTSAFDVDQAMMLWMSSPGHAANVLNPAYQHIGVGYARRVDESIFRHYWVVTFGSLGEDQTASPAPPGEPQLVGTSGELLPLPDALTAAQIHLVNVAKERDLLRLDHVTLQSRDDSMSERLSALRAIPEDQPQEAWCADFTESLSGEVASVEPPGEGIARMILRPGFDGRAEYDPARDGEINHRAGMSGPQAYWNAAVLPGWQKWRPMYRVGVLTAKDETLDTGSVTLDEEVSSAVGLPINVPTAFSGIPIEYMDCNAKAFEVGDRVLVEMPVRSWESAKIIGFESNPKPCEYFTVTYTASAGLAICGEAVQEVVRGQSTTPVTVISTNPLARLRRWQVAPSVFEPPVNPRQELDVQGDMTIIAVAHTFPSGAAYEIIMTLMGAGDTTSPCPADTVEFYPSENQVFETDGVEVVVWTGKNSSECEGCTPRSAGGAWGMAHAVWNDTGFHYIDQEESFVIYDGSSASGSLTGDHLMNSQMFKSISPTNINVLQSDVQVVERDELDRAIRLSGAAMTYTGKAECAALFAQEPPATLTYTWAGDQSLWSIDEWPVTMTYHYAGINFVLTQVYLSYSADAGEAETCPEE